MTTLTQKGEAAKEQDRDRGKEKERRLGKEVFNYNNTQKVQ